MFFHTISCVQTEHASNMIMTLRTFVRPFVSVVIWLGTFNLIWIIFNIRSRWRCIARHCVVFWRIHAAHKCLGLLLSRLFWEKEFRRKLVWINFVRNNNKVRSHFLQKLSVSAVLDQISNGLIYCEFLTLLVKNQAKCTRDSFSDCSVIISGTHAWHVRGFSCRHGSSNVSARVHADAPYYKGLYDCLCLDNNSSGKLYHMHLRLPRF